MLGRFLDWVYIAVGALAAFALFSLYDGMVDDPLVRREALRGYVLKSERDAIASQLAEERRRALAAAQTAEEFKRRYTALSERNKANSEKAEQDIESDNRTDDGAPRVTSGDLDWLSKH
ncbi:hypothetical protein SJ05684_c10900 [Sinorhizobium sojae CCBAU 05684]|uniref:Uncharacterized protein n=2 Tax=Sinorhizobium sojae TaxID=716925 RepID=A0A249PA22_9HYPH|nr:hypothetical protein SJ05684_c10900 [Sinorhizobium sojae CCBAU 05684]